MNRLFVFSTLLSVIALSASSLAGDNRYGAPHSGNSLHYRGGSRYPSAPAAPSSPHSPRTPHAPAAPAYGGAPRSHHGHGYGGGLHHSAAPSRLHHSAPGGAYGGGRHYNPSNVGLNHFSGPAPYAGHVPYAGHAHASAGSSHSRRSVYQPQESSHSSSSRTNYQPHQPQQQNYAHSHQHAQSSATTTGREMKYTVRDPQNRGTTHVTETHIVSNKQMHGAEAEAAMKRLMGSMGPGSDSGFNDFFKGMGLPSFY